MRHNRSSYTIDFSDTDYAPVSLPTDNALPTTLTLQNSPILFGCRTGICGTCLVAVTGHCLPPTPDEKEVLDILAPESPKARLACQLKPIGDISITLLTP